MNTHGICTQYNTYIISKMEPFNSNKPSRKDYIHKYIKIKKKIQNKYDNSITIIIYNEIR